MRQDERTAMPDVRVSDELPTAYACHNYARDGRPVTTGGPAAQAAHYLDEHDPLADPFMPRSEASIVDVATAVYPGVRSVGVGKSRRFVAPHAHDDMYEVVDQERMTPLLLDVLRGVATWAADRAADPELGDEGRKATLSYGAWAAGLQRDVKLDQLLALWAKTVAVPEGALDADPDLLGSPLGVIDRFTGTLVADGDDPDRARRSLVTRAVRGLVRCTMTYGSPALVPDPKWGEIELDAMDGDREMYNFFQKLCAYACLGDGERDLLVILYGPTTRNGKGVTTAGLMYAMGDYAVAAPPELIEAGRRRQAGAPDEVTSSLEGRRLIVVSELTRGRRLDEAKIKALTGGNEISTRGIYERQRSFRITGTVIVDTNHLPDVVDRTVFQSGRILVVPFDHQVPLAQRDPTLADRLRTDRGATTVLAWLLDGYARYRREGLVPPERVVRATEAYEKRCNSVLAFLQDCCETSPDATVGVGELRHAYYAYCEDEDLTPLGIGLVKDVLAAEGVTEGRTSNGRYYRGIRLR